MPKRASYEVVVIGSGFGGSVMALRLAQAGKKVCVLERGRRYAKEDFPRSFEQFVRSLWTDTNEGMFDFRFSHDMNVVSASGVGGGSLIYANVQIRPDEKIFAEGGWPRQVTGRAQLDPYLDLVADMLKITPVNKTLPKGQAIETIAHRLGRDKDLVVPNLAILFASDPSQEGDVIKDPFKRGGPPQGTCIHCCKCVIGCHLHSKNTVDLNYLWIAEHKYGAEIAPLHEVTRIEPENKGYRVYFHQRENGRNPEGSIHGDVVVLGAGAVGSTELLLRCKHEYRTLPRLSDALGLHFSGNADLQAGAISIDPKIPVRSTYGPTITRGIEFPEHGVLIEEGGVPPEFGGLMEALYSPVGGLSTFISALLRGRRTQVNFKNFLEDLFDVEAPMENQLIFLIMGRDAADGKLRLSPSGRLEIQWDNARSQPVFGAIEQIVRDMVRKVGGTAYFNPEWALLEKMTTVHPLGGCAMAEDYTDGVVNHQGEVFNYPGLYVTDGSIIPRAIGKNPAMTISALAERIAFWMINRREMTAGDPRTPVNA
jgi:cholesterol oxidase